MSNPKELSTETLMACGSGLLSVEGHCRLTDVIQNCPLLRILRNATSRRRHTRSGRARKDTVICLRMVLVQRQRGRARACNKCNGLLKSLSQSTPAVPVTSVNLPFPSLKFLDLFNRHPGLFGWDLHNVLHNEKAFVPGIFRGPSYVNSDIGHVIFPLGCTAHPEEI